MADQAIRISADALQRFSSDIFAASGMPPEHAEMVGAVLVWANLRGVDSHGVLRIPRYVALIDHGRTNPRPDIKTVTETAASFLLDTDRAAGPVAMTLAMEKAIPKAREAGLCWGLVRGTTHAGAVGYYTLLAAEAGLAGMTFVASVPNMAYHGTRIASIATNPLAIAVPGGDHPPLMLDMATAIASWGKIALARDSGKPLAAGLALDREGNPTTDPVAANIPLPLGGPKGAGLSLMFECLVSLMVGNPIIADALDAISGADRHSVEGDRHRQNGLVVAIDVSKFTDLDRFRAEVDRLSGAVKALPKAEGVDEILVPGEHGDRIKAERSVEGIPIPGGTWERLAEVADRFGVGMPEKG